MLDQVHPSVASAEGEHFRLVFPLPQKSRDFGDFHLEQTSVDVRGQKGRPFRADSRGDVRVVTRLVWDSLPDFSRPLPKAADCSGLSGRSPRRAKAPEYTLSRASFWAASTIFRDSSSERARL